MRKTLKAGKKHHYLLALITTTGLLLSITGAVASSVYTVDQDVMASPFFSGLDRIRGYDADSRNTHRVSSTNPFGTSAAETVYMDFSSADFSSFTGPVHAELTVQSVSGGFNADASAGNPFTVSAHALNAQPLNSIIDDTNAGGTIGWTDFFSNNIEAADSAALTSVNGFGSFTFDVSSIVNDWVLGANTIQSMALTGDNDTSGSDFLHGFLNNSENPGSTYLTVSAVPIPSAIWLMVSGLVGFMGISRNHKLKKISS